MAALAGEGEEVAGGGSRDWDNHRLIVPACLSASIYMGQDPGDGPFPLIACT